MTRAKDFSTKRALSGPRKRLLELIQRYDFCRIEHLEVRGGEPTFNPGPHVTEEFRLGSKSTPRSEFKDDFQLPAPVIELFERLSHVGNGWVAVIEIRHGLPVRLIVERPVSEVAP